jgi:hypothetical protein
MAFLHYSCKDGKERTHVLPLPALAKSKVTITPADKSLSNHEENRIARTTATATVGGL